MKILFSVVVIVALVAAMGVPSALAGIVIMIIPKTISSGV